MLLGVMILLSLSQVRVKAKQIHFFFSVTSPLWTQVPMGQKRFLLPFLICWVLPVGLDFLSTLLGPRSPFGQPSPHSSNGPPSRRRAL